MISILKADYFSKCPATSHLRHLETMVANDGDEVRGEAFIKLSQPVTHSRMYRLTLFSINQDLIEFLKRGIKQYVMKIVNKGGQVIIFFCNLRLK